MNGDDEFQYSYSSKPRAVQSSSRAKSVQCVLAMRLHVDGITKTMPPNIMHDPRVMRGSMFAGQQAQTTASRHADARPKKRRSSNNSTGSNKPATKSIYEAQKIASYTFTPFSLDANLIEQLPAVPERESSSQTDAFATQKSVTIRPKGMSVDGVFQRPKVGVDSSTQIEDSDKLFDFDVEVTPLLNVLVSKTIAQALAEVKEETEMRTLQSDRAALLAVKADAVRADRELEREAQLAQREKDEATRANARKRERRRVLTAKVRAWQLAHALVPHVVAQTTAALEAAGVFYNPLHRDLQHWLATDVFVGADAKIQLRRVAAQLLEDLVTNSLRRQTILSQLLGQEHEAMVRLLLRDALLPGASLVVGNDDSAAAAATQISQDTEDSDGIRVIGPIAITRVDSLDAIEQKIQAWITEHVVGDVVVPRGGFLSVLNLTGNTR